MAKFEDRLKELRMSKGMSQMDLAKAIKTSKSSINMYERGEREPGIEKLESIADFFNVDLDFLLGKSEYENKHKWLLSTRRSQHQDTQRSNMLKIAGRDGSYQERTLTDQQMAEIKEILDKMPDVPDDL